MARLMVLLLVLVWPGVVLAGLSSPNSYLVPSSDGRRVLVMLSGDRTWDRTRTAALPDGRVVDLYATFGKSGLYDARSLEPKWQVPWFSLGGDLFYSPDLRYVIRVCRPGLRSGWALRFYTDGRLVREHSCSALLTGLRSEWFLPYSTWDWHPRWYDDYDIDATGTRFNVTTARRRLYVEGRRFDLGLQESYTFDVATGEVLSQGVRGRWVVRAYGAGVPAGVVAGMVVVRLGWRFVRARPKRAGFPVICTLPA
jgi:hypothetical protein